MFVLWCSSYLSFFVYVRFVLFLVLVVRGSQRANQPLLDWFCKLPRSAATARVVIPSSARFLREGLEHAGHQGRRRRGALQVHHLARNRAPRFFEVGPTNDDLALVDEIQAQWVNLFCDQVCSCVSLSVWVVCVRVVVCVCLWVWLLVCAVCVAVCVGRAHLFGDQRHDLYGA